MTSFSARVVLVLCIALVSTRATKGQDAPRVVAPPIVAAPAATPPETPSTEVAEPVAPTAQGTPPPNDDAVLSAGLGGPGGGFRLGGSFGGFGGFGGVGLGGGAVGGPGYSAVFYPSRPVSGQGSDLTLVRESLGGAVPVWKQDGDLLLATAGVRNDLFSTSAVLPDTHRPFPSTLWSINGGLTFVHQFSGGWTGGLMTNFGSASDKPFHSIDEMSVSMAGFLRVPARNDRDAWMFSLMYSPVGLLNFPIPGVAYLWNPSDQLRMSIGLPFSLAWQPTEDLAVSLAYVPLTNVRARVTYRLVEHVYMYGGFEWLNESYFLADRPDVKDRFFGFEKRLIGGVQLTLWRNALIDLNSGYAFDRYYAEGTNQNSGLHDRVDIAPGAFLAGSLRLRF
jgi:hypothetical protein